MEKKLYRNDYDKVIAGVSSGLADYMQMDVTLVRLAFVLLSFLALGTGIIVYIAMWIIIPVNNDPAARAKKFNDYFKQHDPSIYNSANAFNNAGNTETNKWNTTNASFGTGPVYDPGAFKKKDNTARTIAGLALLIIGLFFLVRELHILPYWVSLHKLWPVALVAVGVSFILRSKKDTQWENFKAENLQPKEPIVTPPPTAEPRADENQDIQNP